MTVEIIPTSNDGRSHYTQTTKLAGQRYILRFDWIQRAAVWHMSLSTEQGVLILSGLPVVPGVDLLGPYRYNPIVPEAGIVVYDKARRGTAPGLRDLGVDQPYELLFITFELSE